MQKEDWQVIARTSDEGHAERMRSRLLADGLETIVSETIDGVEVAVQVRDERVAKATLEREGLEPNGLAGPSPYKLSAIWLRILVALGAAPYIYFFVYVFTQNEMWGLMSALAVDTLFVFAKPKPRR